MSHDILIPDYFSTYPAYFWEWQEGINILCIKDGGTIAYKEFICEVVEMLSAQGLPSFGALLMVIAATKPGDTESVKDIDDAFDRLIKFNPSANIDSRPAMGLLRRLAQLPLSYKSGRLRLQDVRSLGVPQFGVSGEVGVDVIDQLIRSV